MNLIHKILYFLTLKHHHCGNLSAYASRFLVSDLLFSASKTTAFTTLKLRTQMLPRVQKYSEEQPATISAFQLMKQQKDFYRVQLDQQRKAANIMLEIAQRVRVEWKMHLKRNRNSRPV